MPLNVDGAKIGQVAIDGSNIKEAWMDGRQVYSSGIELGNIPIGNIIRINENGVPTNFKVIQHDYIKTGVTAIIRDLLLPITSRFNSNGVNEYEYGDVDNFLTETYTNMLDSHTKNALIFVDIPYTPGNTNMNVGSISRNCFALSATELGQISSFANVEGVHMPIFPNNTSRIKYREDAINSPSIYHTRSPRTDSTTSAYRVSATGGFATTAANTNPAYIAPALTLPSSFPITKDMIVT